MKYELDRIPTNANAGIGKLVLTSEEKGAAEVEVEVEAETKRGTSQMTCTCKENHKRTQFDYCTEVKSDWQSARGGIESESLTKKTIL